MTAQEGASPTIEQREALDDAMPTPSQALIDAVRALHNEMYSAELYKRYREYLSSTPEKNIEGGVCWDEACALRMMHEVGIVKGIAVIAMQKIAWLQPALHAVLLADGLGGSLEGAQRYVAAAVEEGRRENEEARKARNSPGWRAFVEEIRREFPRRPAKKMN
jgi:hypothetical protein